MKSSRFDAENGFDILDAINSRFPVFERVDRRRKRLPNKGKTRESSSRNVVIFGIFDLLPVILNACGSMSPYSV